jgi:hypothetical protein
MIQSLALVKSQHTYLPLLESPKANSNDAGKYYCTEFDVTEEDGNEFVWR